MTLIEAAAIGGRFLQFGGGALLAGGGLFLLQNPAAASGAGWAGGLARTGALAGFIGVIAWLLAQTAGIGDGWGDVLDPSKLWAVVGGTGFGQVALLRLLIFALALAAATPAPRWSPLAALGVLATGSMAWTGHGAVDDGLTGAVHLAADVLHLLASAVWVGALACLSLLGRRAVRNLTGAGPALVAGLNRFSEIGLGVVVTLALSGLANAWFVLPLQNPRGVYVELLMLKLLAFAVMLFLAAQNRYRHTPALEAALAAGDLGGHAYRAAARSVLIETALAAVVLFLVSWLGTVAPMRS